MTMLNRTRTVVLAACVAAAVAACAGGSGSSGFDVAFENQLIDEALQQMKCTESATLFICPADQPADLPPPTGSPQMAPEIDTGFGDTTAATCDAAAIDRACAVRLPLAPAGLPAGAVLAVAVRSTVPPGDWTTDGEAIPVSGPTEVNAQVPAGSSSVQIAVLVFFDGVVPLPAGRLETLTGSGADLAFVTPSLQVERADGGPA